MRSVGGYYYHTVSWVNQCNARKDMSMRKLVMTENKQVNVVSRSFLPLCAHFDRGFTAGFFFRNAYRLSFRGDLAFEQDMDMGIGVIIDSMKAPPILSRLPRIFLRDFRSCYTTVGERGAKFLEREAL